jgi:hypothetical protein
MKTITFDYTKKNGETSERTLMILKEPYKDYDGIDITPLDPDIGAEFVSEYSALHEEFLTKCKELQAKYDVKHNYRHFLIEGMSNVIEI